MCRAVLRSRLKLPSINNKKVQRSLELLGLCIARSSAVSKFSRYSSYCPVPLDGASKDSLPPGWKYSVFGCAAAGGHSSNLFHSLVPTSNTIAFGMGGGSALSGEGVLRCLHGERAQSRRRVPPHSQCHVPLSYKFHSWCARDTPRIMRGRSQGAAAS